MGIAGCSQNAPAFWLNYPGLLNSLSFDATMMRKHRQNQRKNEGCMSKNEKPSAENTDTTEPLSDEQLEKVSGGFIIQVRESAQPTTQTEARPTESLLGNPDAVPPSPVKK